MLSQIKKAIETFPERNSFFIGEKFYSYRDLGKAISKIKTRIEEKVSTEEKLIGFLEYDDFETYASAVSILFTKYAFVPLNPENPLDRNSSILDQAEIKTILSSKIDEKILELCREKGINFINTKEIPEAAYNISIPDEKGDDLAYLLFTSGSTGIPKGVPLTRKNLYSFMDAFFALGYKITEEDRVIQMFDMTFDLSLMSYLAPLCKGACVYTVPPGGIKYNMVYTLLEEQEITVALMVPSIIAFLRPYFEEMNFEKMRYSLFCGEALYQDVVLEWSKCVPNALVQNVYGPTEATIFCLTYDIQKEPGKNKSYNGIVCIGKPMMNMGAIVVDENLKPVSKGEKGELCLTGSQMTPGYWKNPGKNKEAFFDIEENGEIKRYYRTGDIAFLDDNDDFMFGGRLDHQVKIQGFRVELSEIEHYVRGFTKISNIACIASDNVGAGNIKLYLFVENYEGNTEDISNYLMTKVPKYMIPYSIQSLPVFPLNINGKIDRKALLKMAGD